MDRGIFGFKKSPNNCFLKLINLFLFLLFIFYTAGSYLFYTYQCIHVKPNLPIQPSTTPLPCFPPLVSIRLFSTSVSLFLPCKPGHLYHFSRFHIYALIYVFVFLFLTYFTLYDSLQVHPRLYKGPNFIPFYKSPNNCCEKNSHTHFSELQRLF